MTECPFCASSTDYARISTHWTTNSDCPGPELTPSQRRLTHGLLLSGANYYQKDANRYSGIQIDSTQRAFVEWVRDEYGILADGQEIQSYSAAEVAESFGHDPAERPNIRPQYRLRTYSSKVFEQFGGERDYPLSTQALRVWFARSGATASKDTSTSHRLHIGLSYAIESDADWEARFGAYDDRSWRQVARDSSPAMALFRKAEIQSFLDAHPTVPGYEWKWDMAAQKPTPGDEPPVANTNTEVCE